MVCNKIVTLILTLILLLTLPCFASEKNLRIFNTDHFTINIPANMRPVTKSEMPSVDDENSLTYLFIESEKEKEKSMLLVISLDKINSPAPNHLADASLKEMAKGLQSFARNNSKCPSRTTGLQKIRLAGQKAFYFERKSKNCVVMLERYWITIKGQHAFSIYLAEPANANDSVSGRVVKEIAKIKLK